MDLDKHTRKQSINQARKEISLLTSHGQAHLGLPQKQVISCKF